jgi:hypothetical protein
MAMDDHHMEQVKSVLERTGMISRTAPVTEVRTSPAGVYRILTNSLGKCKVCTKCTPHLLYKDQRSTCVFLTTTHLLGKLPSIHSARGVTGQCSNSMN